MNILILEDERRAANRLTKMLGMYDPSFKICECLDTVKDGIQWLKTNIPPDLIFMDISLADGLCFSIFEEIQVTSPIIFTTAYDQYALKAFKVNTIDYLLKPLNYTEFKAAMDKFRAWKKNSSADSTSTFPSAENNYRNRFVLKIGEQLITVDVENISCCKSIEKTTYLLCKNNKRIICDYTLGQLTSMLDPSSFFRVNRQYLIQREKIQTIKSYPNSRLQLFIEGYECDEIVVSRERVNDFTDWFKSN